MKEFFYSCLEDLESLTGLKQYFFLQRIDPIEFQRQAKLLVDGMEKVCGEFARLSDERKKTIIREMMVKDQDYESLNSRTVYRWLTMHNPIALERHEEAPRIELTEEEKVRVDELAEEFKRNLIGFAVPCVTGVPEEMKKIEREDEISKGQKAVSVGIPSTDREYLEQTELRRQYGLENHDLLTGAKLPTWMSYSDWLETKR